MRHAFPTRRACDFVLPFIGIWCGAGGLRGAVDPVMGNADDAAPVDGIGGGWRIELHGSGPLLTVERGKGAGGQLLLEGIVRGGPRAAERSVRSEEHTSELQSLMRISYAVFCLKKKIISYYEINCH